MPETKTFPLNVVLTVTTGLLLTRPKRDRDNGIGDLYELLDWMTNDQLYTHQLPRASNECLPVLLATFPELALVETDGVNQLFKEHGAKAIDLFIAREKERVPSLRDAYDVPRVKDGVHEVKNPLIELTEMISK